MLHKLINWFMLLFILYVVVHQLWIIPAAEKELTTDQLESVLHIIEVKNHDVEIKHTSTGVRAFSNTRNEDLEVLEYINNSQVLKFKRVVIAQWLHESDSLRSAIYNECNNGFGMKVAVVRKTTNIGKCRGHARYSSKVDSVKDYEFYQLTELPAYERKIGRKLSSELDYLRFLKDRRYAEDPKYNDKLRSWISRLD